MSSVVLGERFERALGEATAAQRDRTWAWSSVPGVAHVLGVCALVLEHGGSEDEAIAALLVETAQAPEQAERIRAAYGDGVAAIVAGCNAPVQSDAGPQIAYFDRKSAHLEALARRDGPSDAILLVDAAKTWYAANDLNEAFGAGRPAFEVVDIKKYGTLWYFRAFADVILEYEGRHEPFGRRLIELVDDIAGRHVTADALLAAFAIDASVDRAQKGTLLERHVSV